MINIVLALIFLLLPNLTFAQYDAECFINTKKEIKLTIERLPVDSIHFQDTIFINGQNRFWIQFLSPAI